ncbi:hypothetical protein KGM_203236 [Danaus plexippus plexippus]|uniref:Uncharacterized protein n=3 Tax=Danaus plexippus TaxID=13037 RepID=A0A212FIU2_DANPL|nr:hypothetical protein KGM_203236 [Danaus plexippus plexippus]
MVPDRLVEDALRRASLTNKPSVVKYPPDYFNSAEEHSSSSDDEKQPNTVIKDVK